MKRSTAFSLSLSSLVQKWRRGLRRWARSGWFAAGQAGGRPRHLRPTHLEIEECEARIVFSLSSSVYLYSSINPSYPSQAVTLTATLGYSGPIPSGSVEFWEGTTDLGNGFLADGQATLTIAALTAGYHEIVAAYSGDSNYDGSSASLSQLVITPSAFVCLSSSVNPSFLGQEVTLTAGVWPLDVGPTPTGSVQFWDGATSLGSSTLCGGQATLTTAALSEGEHSIAAVYSGDSVYGSMSSSLTQTVSSQTVTMLPTNVSLYSSVNPSSPGESVTLTASVWSLYEDPAWGFRPSGWMQFWDGTLNLGSSWLMDGQAALTTMELSSGAHTITASYSGDGTFAGSTSDTLTQAVSSQGVTMLPANVSLSSSENPSSPGQAVTLTSFVWSMEAGAPVPSGSVEFRDGSTSLGSGTLCGGQATLTTAALSEGEHSIAAVYSGDGTFAGSTSDALTQTVSSQGVTMLPANVSLSSSVNPSSPGQVVTWTANVSSGGSSTPTGTVQFWEGSTDLGGGTLIGGQVTLTLAILPLGTHTITAVYSGDSVYASASASLTQVVGTLAAFVSLSSSVVVACPGEAVTLTADAWPMDPDALMMGLLPTGAVQFFDGSTSLGSSTLCAGQATLTTEALAVGEHTITAVYVGDSFFEGTTSAPLTQTVSTPLVYWTGCGGNRNWDEPANWSTGTVPGPNDDVTMLVWDGTIIAPSGINVHSLVTFSGLDVTGSLVTRADSCVRGFLTVTTGVQSQGGTLALWGGASGTGLFSANPGATLAFGACNGGLAYYTMGVDTAILAEGTIAFWGGITTIAGSYNVAGTTVIAGGTVDFAIPVTIPHLLFTSGSLTGSTTVALTGTASWSGGSMTGSGRTVIASGATLSLTFLSSEWLCLSGRLLENHGTVSDQGWLMINNGSRVSNASDGQWITGDCHFLSASGTGIFHNQGAFTVDAGSTGQASFVGFYLYGGAVYHDEGTTTISTGMLMLTKGTASGTMSVAADAVLAFAADYTLDENSTVLGAGTVTFAGGTTTVWGSYAITGQTRVHGGTAIIKSAQASTGDLTVSAGTLSLDRTVISADTLTVASAGIVQLRIFDPITFSQIQVANLAALDGTLSIAPSDPYFVPAGGYLFPVLTYGASSGNFVSITSPFPLDHLYDTTDLSLAARPDSFTVVHDQVLLATADWGLLRNDPHAAVDSTITILSGPSHGALELLDDGSVVYLAGQGFVGSDEFTFQHNGRGSGTISLTVTDQAPTARDSSYTGRHDRDLIVFAAGVLTGATDPDGDPLTALLVEEPEHGTVALNLDGSFTYEPDLEWTGSDDFSFVANDGVLDSLPVTVSLTITNQQPTAANHSYSCTPGQPLEISSGGLLTSAADPDGDPLMALLASNGPSHGTLVLALDGTFSYMPDQAFLGIDQFAFTLTDGLAFSAPALVTIEVTEPAPIASPGTLSVVHDQLLSLAPQDGLLPLVHVNPNGTICFQAANSGPAHGSLTLFEDGGFLYEPEPGFCGTDAFDYTVSDGYTTSAPATVTLHVTDQAPVAPAATYSTPQGQLLIITAYEGVLAGAADADWDDIQADLLAPPAHGSLTLNPDGSFLYVPHADFSGTDAFTFQPDDGCLPGTPVTVTIQVQADSDLVVAPPVAVDDAYQVLHDTILTVSPAGGLLTNDQDPAGRPLTTILVTGPLHGQLVLNARGSFQYTPTAGYCGLDSFTYRDANGAALGNTAAVFLTVTDTAPLAVPVCYAVSHRATLSVPWSQGLLAGAGDADQDVLTATVAAGPQHGSLALNPDGSFQYTPSSSFVGTDAFLFQLSDGALTTELLSATIQVTNAAPVSHDASYQSRHDQQLEVPFSHGVLAGVVDADGDFVHAVLKSEPDHGSVLFYLDGSFIWLPSTGFSGSVSFTFAPSDGLVEGPVQTVSLTITNPPPTANDVSYQYVPGLPLSISAAGGVLAYGADPQGLALSAALVAGPGHGSVVLQADGSFTYTPDAGFQGADSFTFQLADSAAGSNVATVFLQPLLSLPAVAMPQAANLDFSVIHDTPLDTLISGSSLLSDASDPQGFPLASLLVDNVSHGTLVLLPDGEFLYQPEPGYVGDDQFTYQVCNGLLSSAPAAVTLHVLESAPLPDLQPKSYTIPSGLTSRVAAADGLLAGAGDPEGDFLTAVLVDAPANGFLVVAPDGSFRYTPAAGYTGPDSFTYQVSDGLLDSAIQTVALEIAGTAPSAPEATYAVRHDTTLIVSAAPVEALTAVPALAGQGGGGQGLLAHAVSPSGQPLTIADFSSPSCGSLVLSANGSFRYTPPDHWTGTDAFTYQLSDGNLTSVPITVTLHVTDQDPTTADLSFTTVHDQALLVGAGQGLLSQTQDGDGDLLTLSVNTQNTLGSLTWHADGSFVYTPPAGWSGLDSFTYAVNDGAQSSPETSVTIQVTDQAPTLVDSSFDVTHDTHLLIGAARGLLSCAADADSDYLTIVNLTAPAHGSLTWLRTGAFKYIPEAHYAGPDSFSYQVSDGVLTSSSATVSLNVINHEPVSDDPGYSVCHDQQLAVPARDQAGRAQGLLAHALDTDNDPLTLIIQQQPEFGTLTLKADGGFIYLPDPGFAGLDGFSYTLNDGVADSDLVVATINVQDNPPVVVPKTFTVHRNSILSITDAGQGILGGAFDPENDPITLSLVVPGQGGTPPILSQATAHGNLTIKPDGALLYRPNPGFSGTDSFTFQLSDGINTTTETDFINVVNDAPLLTNISYMVSAGSTLAVGGLGVLGTAKDPNGDPLTVDILQGSSNGSFNLHSDGSFSYTAGNVGANDSYLIAVSDGAVLTPVWVSFNVTADTFATPLTAAQAIRDSDTTLANNALAAALAANITRITSEFHTQADLNASLQAQGDAFAAQVRQATAGLLAQEVALQAGNDAQQSVVAAQLAGQQQALDDALWQQTADADQDYADALQVQAVQAANALTSAGSAAQNARAAANAVLLQGQVSLIDSLQQQTAAAEEAYNSVESAARQAYVTSCNQAEQAYRLSLDQAADYEALALAQSNQVYQGHLSFALNVLQIEQGEANAVYQPAVAAAQSQLASQLQAAQAQYNAAVAQAAALYGISNPGSPPDVGSDSDYQQALAVALNAYATAVAESRGSYAAALATAQAARDSSLQQAQAAYDEVIREAQAEQQQAMLQAEAAYAASLLQAQVIHDQALSQAWSSYRTTMQQAAGPYHSAAQSANQVYDASVAAALSANWAPVDQAQSDYRSAQQSLAAVYNSQVAGASSIFQSALKANRQTYTSSVRQALAAELAAVQQAEQQFQGQLRSASQVQQQAILQAQGAFNSTRTAAQKTYEQTRQRAENNYQQAVQQAQNSFDRTMWPWRWLKNRALDLANGRWMAAIATAQAICTSQIAEYTYQLMQGDSGALDRINQARKDLAVAKAQADLAYQQAVWEAQVFYEGKEKAPAVQRAVAVGVVSSAQAATLSLAERQYSQAVGPAGQLLQAQVEQAASALAAAVAVQAMVSNQAVATAQQTYQQAVDQAARVQAAGDSAALAVQQQALAAAGQALGDGQALAWQVEISTLNQVSSLLQTQLSAATAAWTQALVAAGETFQQTVDTAAAVLSGTTATAEAELLAAQGIAAATRAATGEQAKAALAEEQTWAAGVRAGAAAQAGAAYALAQAAAWTAWVGHSAPAAGIHGAMTVVQTATGQAWANAVASWASGQGTAEALYQAAAAQSAADLTAATATAQGTAAAAESTALNTWVSNQAPAAGAFQGLQGALAGQSVAAGERAANRVEAALQNLTAGLEADAERSEAVQLAIGAYQASLSQGAAARAVNLTQAMNAVWLGLDTALSSWSQAVQQAGTVENSSAVAAVQGLVQGADSARAANEIEVDSAYADWLEQSATALAGAWDASAAAEALWQRESWSAWLTAAQAYLAADQVQAIQDSASAEQALAPILAAEEVFAAAQASAYAANAEARTAVEWDYRIAQTQINGDRAVSVASEALAELQAEQDLSKFASPYLESNGPGTNGGTNNNRDLATTIAAMLDWYSGGTSTAVLCSPEFGAALNATDQFFAGMADSLTMGLSTRARAWMYGDTATQNHQGEWFNAGKMTGQVLGVAIAFGNPCSMGIVGNVGYRLLNGMQAVGGTINAVENMVDGKYGAAILDGVGVLGNMALMTRACFTGDMHVLTRRGWVRWDELKVGDKVACCDENNPHGTIEYRPVEELFVTRAPIWHVQVQGRVIRTTADHPIFVWGKGWVAARRLEPGDRLCSDDGQVVAVEAVSDTELEEPVYNCRVAEYHTYFVGGANWGFSVWAHNNCYEVGTAKDLRKTQQTGTQVNHVPQSREAGLLVGGWNPLNKVGNEPAIRLPISEHEAVTAAQAARGALVSARDLLASDIRILRNYTNAPNSALLELIEMNRRLHPTDYLPLHR